MATTTDSIGRVLARRYRIESALGSGTSATVYAAWDTVLQRRVAVKVLHPGLAGDGSFLRRFRYEAQSAAALTHPHVLSVYDWGEDDRGPFLVLEYLGGGSLRDLLDDGRRLSVAQAAAVGVQAAGALAYAHGRGFVHRDIKPANLVFDEDGRLRIADFGLARALAEAAMTEPAGATVGTARYAAPEQALGKAVDGRADVYALALVLYEAVTGVVPFSADTTAATLMARVGATLPGHDGLGPLAAVLDDAAAPELDRRIDALALADRLNELGHGLATPEPLPLAGAGGRGLAQAGARAIDRTEHGMGPVLDLPLEGAPPAPDAFDAMALATAVGVAAAD
ncbi:MAG: protein kinase domain-containing protein, partial [Acidimicrobiales bacterium]